MLLAPGVQAAKPVTPVVVAATMIDLEVAELGKDGARRATMLTLSLPDRNGRGGPSAAELKTRVTGERGEFAEYDAKVMPEDTTAGTRYVIELRRSGNDANKGFDMKVEVARVLKAGAPVQISRVTRPDGSGMIVTATVR
ncbi:MAG TPA: hypothetical protein VGB85_30820 [Nannocystis sp.]|jgi:hypothetical protein